MQQDSPPDPDSQASKVIEALEEHSDAYLIAVTGIPGSGKSTLCQTISSRMPDCAVLPMDGYHIPRSQLSSVDLKRRGAPHTFNWQTMSQDLEHLRVNRQGQFPAFDHATKDPDADKIKVTAEHNKVFVEGNYLLLQEWGLEPLFDFTVFVDCDLETAMERVATRLFQCGICSTPQEARHQAENNDRLNAQLIIIDQCADRSNLYLPSGE